MSHRFDDIARTLASPMPRRKALKIVLGATVAGGFAFILPKQAHANRSNAGAADTGPGTPCTGFAKGVQCPGAGGNTNCPAAGDVAPCPAGGAGNCCETAAECTKTGCCTVCNKAGAKANTCCPSGTLCCPDNTGTCCGPGKKGGTKPNCCHIKDPEGNVTLKCCGFSADPSWNAAGGGTFLDANRAKNLLVCKTCGCTAAGDATSFNTNTDMNGSCSAYDFATRTQINTVSFSSIQGNLLGGGDLTFSGTGTANVNGVLTNIAFDVSKAAGVTTFEMRNADTMAVLAGGTGEAGRSAFDLEIFA